MRIGSREPWVEPRVRNTSRTDVATCSLWHVAEANGSGTWRACAIGSTWIGTSGLLPAHEGAYFIRSAWFLHHLIYQLKISQKWCCVFESVLVRGRSERGWWSWWHVWCSGNLSESSCCAWQHVLSLMPNGKLGFCRFLNSLLIYVISFSEIRIFVVGGFGWIFFFWNVEAEGSNCSWEL